MGGAENTSLPMGTLEHATEDAYCRRLDKRQAESNATNSHKEEAKKLPQECQAAWNLQKQQATPAREDLCPASTESSFLYPHWQVRESTKLPKADKACPYKAPKDEKEERISLDKELDAKSVFDPLAPSSQSSSLPGSQLELAGPKTLPHYAERGPMSIAPFDLSLLNVLASDTSLLGSNAYTSLVTEQDNTLLGLAPGSPKKSSMGFFCVPRGSISGRGLEHTSCASSPMSIGSPTGLGRGAALAKALKA